MTCLLKFVYYAGNTSGHRAFIVLTEDEHDCFIQCGGQKKKFTYNVGKGKHSYGVITNEKDNCWWISTTYLPKDTEDQTISALTDQPLMSKVMPWLRETASLHDIIYYRKTCSDKDCYEHRNLADLVSFVITRAQHEKFEKKLQKTDFPCSPAHCVHAGTFVWKYIGRDFLMPYDEDPKTSDSQHEVAIMLRQLGLVLGRI